MTQNYILRLNGWEIKDGALGRHINSFLSLRFNSADSGSIKTFTCAAPPQLPLLNLQLRRGCLSGHGDEEEGTID